MTPKLSSVRLLLVTLAGWVNRHQQEVINYLREENRVLREQLGSRRVRLNDDQRRRLAVRAKTRGTGAPRRDSAGGGGTGRRGQLRPLLNEQRFSSGDIDAAHALAAMPRSA